MSLTIIDWLGFRTKSDIRPLVDVLGFSFRETGADVRLKPRKGGWRGFDQSADILLDDLNVGLVAYGGEGQNEWVSVNLTGRGCSWLGDIDAAESIISDLPNYETRRVDIALDTFHREVTHEKVVSAYEDGQFRLAGRPPKFTQILPGQIRDGRTVYIGNRDQSKFLRAYEKGYELISGIQSDLDITHIDGVPVGDIYRLELELKPKNAPLPVDLIERRDQYFAGSYPYLQSVISVEPEVFQTRRERAAQLSLDAALSQIRKQYGSTLFTALTAYHGDVGAVWEKVVGKKHNQSLLDAGVLMVEHGEVFYS